MEELYGLREGSHKVIVTGSFEDMVSINSKLTVPLTLVKVEMKCTVVSDEDIVNRVFG